MFALKQNAQGVPAQEICRKLGVSEQSFYKWKKRYGSMDVSETKRLSELDKLNNIEKLLVEENFPVLYGIRIKEEKQFRGTQSNEIAIYNGVGPNEIVSIFVPRNKIDIVKNLLTKQRKSNNIKVLPIEEIDPLSKRKKASGL